MRKKFFIRAVFGLSLVLVFSEKVTHVSALATEPVSYSKQDSIDYVRMYHEDPGYIESIYSEAAHPDASDSTQ